MNLVYFTVGGQPGYVSLLSHAIHTLRSTSPLPNTKVMVMCDASYRKYVEPVDGIDDIMVSRPNKDHIQTSMRKVEIFSYHNIDAYDKVLFLDCDLVVLEDMEAEVFPLITSKEKLHVVKESNNTRYHLQKYHGFSDYTDQEIALFKERQQHVFNCGHFGFRVSEVMKRHFANVRTMIRHWKSDYFYEQSFMNKYFNSNFLTIENLHKCIEIHGNALEDEPIPSRKCIIHFASGSPLYQAKLNLMKAVSERPHVAFVITVHGEDDCDYAWIDNLRYLIRNYNILIHIITPSPTRDLSGLVALLETFALTVTVGDRPPDTQNLLKMRGVTKLYTVFVPDKLQFWIQNYRFSCPFCHVPKRHTRKQTKKKCRVPEQHKVVFYFKNLVEEARMHGSSGSSRVYCVAVLL